ncbi:MAG: CDP-alcohol phosphatidyltransferase family protein [Actinomycetota bacterium]|jgi:CDP-diacylglycerol--glycerol-3-phosphate 3-phosphatidyltransferase|nr:CDP-alcohol phosphatidyltransferase family protein [Euzebyaceae bacterium]MDQ3453304.1 CDP-alcohol phosphatidyltransferase family protein [Actinomycetota bacterium]
MAINAYARTATDRLVVPIARGLVRVGVTPNWLTFFGLVTTLLGVVAVLRYGRAGAFILALGTATDAFDGSVARLRGSSSRVGAFYDSVTDRVSDASILGAAVWLVRDDPLLFGVAMVALAGAQLTSYVRAKAESLGWTATVGVIERPERMAIIVLGIGFDLLTAALWLLAIGSLVTVAQRLHAVLAQAGSR